MVVVNAVVNVAVADEDRPGHGHGQDHDLLRLIAGLRILRINPRGG